MAHSSGPTAGHTHRHTDIQTHRDIHRHKHKDIGRHTDTQRLDTEIHTHRDASEVADHRR